MRDARFRDSDARRMYVHTNMRGMNGNKAAASEGAGAQNHECVCSPDGKRVKLVKPGLFSHCLRFVGCTLVLHTIAPRALCEDAGSRNLISKVLFRRNRA